MFHVREYSVNEVTGFPQQLENLAIAFPVMDGNFPKLKNYAKISVILLINF